MGCVESTGIGSRWTGRWRTAPLGGEKTGPNPTDRGKSGMKRTVLTEGHGVPIGRMIEGARSSRHETAAPDDREHQYRARRRQPRRIPMGCAWRNDTTTRRCATCFTNVALLPLFGHEEKRPRLSRWKPTAFARSFVVERVHAWMNRFRRLLVRWDKKPQHYLAFLHFACGLIAFRAAGLLG